MPEFSNTVCPIWFRGSSGYELEGSAVLLEIGPLRFLVTAAHVLDRAGGSNPLTPCIGLARGFLTITGEARGTLPPNGDRMLDRVDLAFVALDNHAAEAVKENYAYLPIQCLDVHDPGLEGTRYVVNGCPWKKVEHEGKMLMPNQYELQLLGKPHSEYEGLDISPLTHIAMHYDRKKMMDGLGERVTSPKPSGMSGGPVWRMVSSRGPIGEHALSKRLVGIAIEYIEAKRSLVATRISGVLAVISNAFPDVAGLIPNNPQSEIHLRSDYPPFRG
jgi:hypothetical protein